MTQSFTSDYLPNVALSIGQDHCVDKNAEHLFLPDSDQPAMMHPNFDPNFDPKQTPLDPARPLSDIPEPVYQNHRHLHHFYAQSSVFSPPSESSLSKWRLMGSEPLAEHLALLGAANLIALPDSFYQNYSEQPLLSSLQSMTLLDMADIQRVLCEYPQLDRFGFFEAAVPKKPTFPDCRKTHDPDELLSSLYAEDWQVILQPEQFEAGVGNLATDIMACSVAVHVLQQCPTRQSINQRYSAMQICHHVRSYLLSQLSTAPSRRDHYRQIRLFAGHIIVAACHLGWSIQVQEDGHCYFNLSSRCGLLTRYANINDYYINGWTS